ncbi:hypothetical protein FRC98_01300 [Lujinxingia vulgaris]|uniref:Flagellar motor switch protein FliG n=1 Tax=Lujinxingia vulgaris TaxID=2600176 RepID=A0A5C6XJG6_9DELT|nr:hypothetical protein [Lujinxingia vulgaris]TXD39070.1 hypothetical protein FRC98_01300 [Lujinxingia vulgaris]
MLRARHHLIFALLAATFALCASPAFAQGRTGERAAIEGTRAQAEALARAELEGLLSRLCPGRCELVELRAVVEAPRAVGRVTPGFGDAVAGSSYETRVSRIEATVLLDSKLPQNFRANIARMAQFRLQDIAPTIEVRPEFLDFPEPQLPPMPPMMQEEPRPAPRPAPLPPLPEVEDPEPEPATEPLPTPEEPADDGRPLWQDALPWIALLATLLILSFLIIMILRRLEALTDRRNEPTPEPARPLDDAPDARPRAMPDVDLLRDELKHSRPVLNRMLRAWIADDPAEVALLVRLVGSGILSDVRRDASLRAPMETIADEVARRDQPLDADEAHAIAEKARARLTAQQVLDDGSTDAEWEFLEGLGLAHIATLLESCTRRERAFVLTRLSPVVRSRYLEGLESEERRDLLLETSDADALSRTQARELAARQRAMAEEFIDAGREAQGQASMMLEMIEALALREQEDILRDILAKKPAVAEVVLSQMVLESAAMHVPDEPLANALHRIPVDTLALFMRGTRRDIADHLLARAPVSTRQALATELSLDIPSTRAEFLEARRTFSQTLRTTLARDGFEVATYNANALRRGAHARQAPPTEPEVL